MLAVLVGGAALGLLGEALDDNASDAGATASAPAAIPVDPVDPVDPADSGSSTGSRGTDSSTAESAAAAPPSDMRVLPDSSRSGVVAPGRESSGTSVPSGPGGQAARPDGVQPRIVRDGTTALSVPAGEVDKAVQALSAKADSLRGYVESSEVSGTPSTTDDAHQYATVTLRVPTASFDALRTGLDQLGTVSSSTTSSRDVTGEYVDLEARKRALESSRGAYLTLLSKATTVGETLSVQQAIDGVQIQIEQIEGQRMVLADASDLATLTVRVTEAGAQPKPEPGDDPSGLAEAARKSWHRFVNGIEGLVALLGPLALLGLVAGAGYVIFRIVRRLRRGTTAASPAASPAPPAVSPSASPAPPEGPAAGSGS
ncbi:protein of unknown function (DUF4349) [Frankia sp. EI5c]|nr:protein of unknown function (DUF4349) [Frankia sp. EI5c]